MALRCFLRRSATPLALAKSIRCQSSTSSLDRRSELWAEAKKELVPDDIKSYSPPEALDWISKVQKQDLQLALVVALELVEGLTEESFRTYKPPELLKLISLSSPRFLAKGVEQQQALIHLAGLCRPETIEGWSNWHIVAVTRSLLQSKVPPRTCAPLIAACTTVVDRKLTGVQASFMVAAADVFKMARCVERDSPRVLNVIAEWTLVELPHLSLADKMSVIASLMLGGVSPRMQHQLDRALLGADKEKSLVTIDQLLDVPLPIVSSYCQAHIENRGTVGGMPLVQYLLVQLETAPDMFHVLWIIQCCNLKELFTETDAYHVTTLLKANLSDLPTRDLSRLIRALHTRDERTKSQMDAIVSDIVEQAVSMSLAPQYAVHVLQQCVTTGVILSTQALHQLIEASLLDGDAVPLSLVARLLRSVGILYGDKAPSGLVANILVLLGKQSVDIGNAADWAYCARGMASVGEAHTTFLDQVADFYAANMNAVVSRHGIECVSILCLALASLGAKHAPLAQACGTCLDGKLTSVMNQYSLEKQIRAAPNQPESLTLLRNPPIREVLPSLTFIRILAFCYLNQVFPKHGSLALSRLEDSDVKPFLKADIERGLVWTLGPALSAITKKKLQVNEKVRDRLFNLSKPELWPVSAEFRQTVGEALLKYCGGRMGCLRHTFTSHSVRIHFGLLMSATSKAPEPWKIHRIDPEDFSPRKVRSSGFRPVALMCVDSRLARYGAVPLLTECLRLSFTLTGWRLAVVDSAAWPEDPALVPEHICGLISGVVDTGPYARRTDTAV